jgi:hypothetical protein
VRVGVTGTVYTLLGPVVVAEAEETLTVIVSPGVSGASGFQTALPSMTVSVPDSICPLALTTWIDVRLKPSTPVSSSAPFAGIGASP